jgi:hypothetical protein
MQILNIVVSLGSLICFIIILVKMFQNAGALQGILGLICGIWCFIWGWMNAGQARHQEHHADLDSIDPVERRPGGRRRRVQLQGRHTLSKSSRSTRSGVFIEKEI